MIIRTSDGKAFTGKTCGDIVRALAVDSRALSSAPDAFRWQVAQICIRLYKVTVDPSTDETFLTTLSQHNMITFTEGGEL